ncbi:hypothetical protein ACFX13_026842 [Malus domestica]
MVVLRRPRTSEGDDPDPLRLADDTRTEVNSVQADLTNMDLKSISTRSLLDPLTLRKSSHILGPKLLQSVWVRDVGKILFQRTF